jgi:DNA-binding transcriptional LysR family regulator
MTRSFILEDVCVGVLPLSMAHRYLEKGSMIPFLSHKPHYHFGEHRVCATVLEHAKNDPKITALIAILKNHAVSVMS